MQGISFADSILTVIVNIPTFVNRDNQVNDRSKTIQVIKSKYQECKRYIISILKSKKCVDTLYGTSAKI